MTTDMAMETVMETVMGMEAATGVTVGTAAIEPFSPSRPLGPLIMPAGMHAGRGRQDGQRLRRQGCANGSACRLANGFLSRSVLENPALLAKAILRDMRGH